MTDSARLTGKAAAANVDYNVELADGVGLDERLVDNEFERIEREILVDLTLVDSDGAGAAGQDAHARDSLFTPSRTPILNFLFSGRFSCHNITSFQCLAVAVFALRGCALRP